MLYYVCKDKKGRNKKMKQKDKLIEAIQKKGFKVGIIHEEVNHLKDSNIKKIISNLKYDTFTFKAIIKGVKRLVECESVDNEKDITIKSVSYYD